MVTTFTLVIAGLVCAGAVYLAVSGAVGRERRPSPGEWMWVVPLPMYVVAYLGAWTVTGTLQTVIFCSWLLGQLGLSTFAFFWVMRPPPVNWNDRIGATVCSLVGSAITWELVFNPP